MRSTFALLASALVGTAYSTILWDGRLNAYSSNSFLSTWSFSNPVGPYQFYIHGPGAVSEYVNLDASYKNPADIGSAQGIKLTIDKTSEWNNDGMLRTELIPQTTAAINKGAVFYHFSMKHTAVNPPNADHEHQLCFFEGGFTEMKYGLLSGEAGTTDMHLQWMVGGTGKWEAVFTADVWHNIVYAIDFDAQTVAFYHSTGSDDLTLKAGPFSASASSNGADWHLGMLELPGSAGFGGETPEDLYFSGVYIESGSLTTAVAGPGGSSSSGSSSAVAVSSASAATKAASSPSVMPTVHSSSATMSTQVTSTKPVTPSSSSSSPAAPVSVSTSSTIYAASSPAAPTSKVPMTSAVNTTPTSKAASMSKPPSHSATVPTTLRTMTKKPAYTSSAAVSPVAASSTLSSSATVTKLPSTISTEAAPATTSAPAEESGCVVNYVYVDDL